MSARLAAGLILGFALLSALPGGASEPAREDCAATWQKVNGDLFGNRIIHARGRFFATSGTWILTSLDGLVWEEIRDVVPEFTSLYGIAFDGSRFVAVGSQGNIVTSVDGFQWTRLQTPIEGAYDVTWGPPGWVAVGGWGGISFSPDGLNWTPVSAPPGLYNLQVVTYALGHYVAMGSGDFVLTSEDGLTWRADPAPVQSVWGLAFGRGLLVAADWNGDIVVTRDLLSWSRVETGWEPNPSWNGLSYSGGQFLAVGDDALRGAVATSPDGLSWTLRHLDYSPLYLRDACFGNGRFIMVSDNSILSSPDGVLWTDESSIPTWQVSATYGMGRHWVVGHVETGMRHLSVASSEDGFTWSVRYFPDAFPLGLAYAAPGLVVVGANTNLSQAETGIIRWSPDGSDWYPQEIPTTDFLFGVEGESGTYTAVGANGTILRSVDGRNWEEVPRVTPQWLFGVTYGAGIFVAVGSNGEILRSENGWDWVSVPSGAHQDLSALAFGAGRFVAAGHGADPVAPTCILTSEDGWTWTHRETAGFSYLAQRLLYGGGIFLMAGGRDYLYASADAIHWEAFPSASMSQYFALSYGNGFFGASGMGNASASYCRPAAYAACNATSGPAPLASDFKAFVRGATEPCSYLWDFGDGEVSQEVAPSHTFDAPGTYDVRLRVTDMWGAAAPDRTVRVVVAEPCSLGSCSAIAPSESTEGRALLFQGAAVSDEGCPTAFEWDFGDGSPAATGDVLLHTYDAAGTYAWTLTVKSGGAVCTRAGSVAVAPRPHIAGIQKLTSPFRLRVDGAGFHSQCSVKINGVVVPATVTKSPTRVVVKGGKALKAMVPAGQPASVVLVNLDDGGESPPFLWTP